METILIYLLKIITTSSLLYLLYIALFRGKASFKAQRVMLLMIPILATASSTISLNLLEVNGFGEELISHITPTQDDNVATQIVDSSVINREEFRVLHSDSITKSIDLEDYATLLWAIVATALFAVFGYRLYRIYRMRRFAEHERHINFSIYRFSDLNIIFSLGRNIYINRELEGDKLNFALMHEAAHIRNYHYIDKLLIEIFAIALWFNPIIRLIQRELSLIHEYEADNIVIKSGSNIKAYKMFIFEVVTTSTPSFVNGINSSQIKKRFITMSKNYHVSHRALRALMTSLAIVVIAASSVVYVRAEEPEATPHKEARNTNNKTLILDDIQSSVEDKKEEKREVEYAPSVDMRADQLYVTNPSQQNKPIYVVRFKDHTKVYIGMGVRWDRHWFVLSEDMPLIDSKTGDEYMIHSSASGLPLEKVLWANNLQNKFIYFELIYPPLDKDITKVNFVERTKAETVKGYANNRSDGDIGWIFYDIHVQDKVPDFVNNKGSRTIRLDKNFKPQKGN